MKLKIDPVMQEVGDCLYEERESEEIRDYLAQLYWIALTTGDWDAKWAVMVSLWGV